MATNQYPWEKCCYMVNSTPGEEVGSLVKELKEKGKYVFVTDLRKDFYAGLGDWREFVEAMDDDGKARNMR